MAKSQMHSGSPTLRFPILPTNWRTGQDYLAPGPSLALSNQQARSPLPPLYPCWRAVATARAQRIHWNERTRKATLKRALSAWCVWLLRLNRLLTSKIWRRETALFDSDNKNEVARKVDKLTALGASRVGDVSLDYSIVKRQSIHSVAAVIFFPL